MNEMLTNGQVSQVGQQRSLLLMGRLTVINGIQICANAISSETIFLQNNFMQIFKFPLGQLMSMMAMRKLCSFNFKNNSFA
jgi:hypothetical protein